MPDPVIQKITETAARAREASLAVAMADRAAKDRVLEAMAELLERKAADVVAANAQDMQRAREKGLAKNLVDRLAFGKGKIMSRVDSLHRIAALPDPVGETYDAYTAENGMEVSRVRVPLGVILMIYEARPHVTVNAGAFCLKSGNAAILRGGSEAGECNALLGGLWQEALAAGGLPAEAIQVIAGTHEEVDELLRMDGQIDLVIPRGGKELIRAVAEKSRVPVIKHYEGICHVYLDRAADVDQGIALALDSKCLMPEVCNAMETLLVHEALAPELPRIVKSFRDCGVAVKGCKLTRKLVKDVEPAGEDDWRTEYLDMIVSVKVVADGEEAVAHINSYGSHHTDSIVTGDDRAAKAFVERVDSGVVLVNASTMFCDGKSLGMGAEIGISTGKLHARGPMGLRELTSYKFVIRGQGHVMGGPGFLKTH